MFRGCRNALLASSSGLAKDGSLPVGGSKMMGNLCGALEERLPHPEEQIAQQVVPYVRCLLILDITSNA